MLRATMKYGAVRAKVMALCGKLLKEDDWRRLCECTTVADIAAFLRNHPGWSDSVGELSTSPQKLKLIVSRRVFEDYEKLYKFSYLEDKKFLLFILCRTEYRLILDTLGSLGSDEHTLQTAYLTDFSRKYISFDVAALENCYTFPELLETVRGSIFAAPLARLHLNSATGLPDYSEAAVLLENSFYKTVFSYIKTKYNGRGKQKLAEALGAEADLLNIVSILRLQHYFPGSLVKADELLIPISDRLKPELQKQLQHASSEAEALELLRKSPCGKYFTENNPLNLESLYNGAMEAFCRKLMKTPEPSLCIPQAYLTLKELECKKLIRIIEAVNYGLDPKTAL
ncbi:MAG: V-type ATPase subunit [Oscillospiraceae bacterium]